ncbi:MAG: hypothetical protein PWR22_995 [Moorella sp. (in: firmicutes)]|jgi:uncharacterized membrane protein|nr:hypothetical protein [Moorella sp. (in: firmicutes)]
MKRRFFIYGLLGWGMEVLWTGFLSALGGDLRLTATTYLWMFPIYGLAVFLEPVHDAIRYWPWWLRGPVWVSIIWFVEMTTGSVIRLLTGAVPWDYTGKTPWQVGGLIRLDMAPLWFLVGLLFEQVHDYLVRMRV